MTYNFCTLFNKNFLNRGLTLYNSLMDSLADNSFRIFILCLDDETYGILEKMSLKNAKLMRLEDFEKKEPEILKIKSTRTFEEYCWTLGSGLTNHIMENYPDIETIAYLDADLFFFSSPKTIYDLFGNNSIMVIPHNLPSHIKEKKEEVVGKYNVGMVLFRNDENGRACLKWWRDRCVEWCYFRAEPGRFGDQKYLDFFEEKFKGVYVLKHKGSNLAPWCIGNFSGKIKKKEKIFVDGDLLVFFHYSSFGIYFPKSFFRPSIFMNNHQYGKPSKIKKLIYNPYRNALYGTMSQIRKIAPEFTAGTISRKSFKEELKGLILPLFWWEFKNLIRPTLKPIIDKVGSLKK